MRAEAVYGVTATDIKDAKNALDEILGAEGQPRENSGRGGGYYLYRTDSDARLYLMNNKDPEDGERLFEEAANWDVVLHIAGSRADEPCLAKIRSNPNRFTPVIYDEFE